jgi:heat shock protein HslJ
MSFLLRSRASCLVLLALTAFGCGGSSTSPSDVRSITWKLESIAETGAAAVTITNPDRFTLRLESDGRANVGADCNTCNGRYTIDGASIAFTAMACTRAFCGTTVDTTYASALETVTTIAASDRSLILQGPRVTLRFRN